MVLSARTRLLAGSITTDEPPGHPERRAGQQAWRVPEPHRATAEGRIRVSARTPPTPQTSRGPLTVGLSGGRTLGLGDYNGRSARQMNSSMMTGFYPWLGYKVNDRVSVWGVTGY